MEKIVAKIENIGLEKLQEMAVLLFNDERDGAEIVFGAVMDRLMAIMPEAEFVQFCDGM